MFGHERGAFTDARELKLGLFEVADGGTVLLDEVGDMPLAVQPKLLRVLETQRFKRVGGTRDIAVNVRVIAATNRDLERAVAEGRFREDLYYRLKVFPVTMPPLRERPEDIPVLIDYFVGHFNATLKTEHHRFLSRGAELMKAYAWPGNVRELKNIVERAMVLSHGNLVPVDFCRGRSREKNARPNDAGQRQDGSESYRPLAIWSGNISSTCFAQRGTTGPPRPGSSGFPVPRCRRNSKNTENLSRRPHEHLFFLDF